MAPLLVKGRNLDPPALPPFVFSLGPSVQDVVEVLRIDDRQHKCARLFWLARSGLLAQDEATHSFKVQNGANATTVLGPKPYVPNI